MPPLNKAWRIGLPVCTATTATILTACLVCLKNDDLDKEKELQDQELKDFVGPVQEFKEEEILETKDENKGEPGEESSDEDLEGEREEDIDETQKEAENDKGDIKKEGFNFDDFIQKLKNLPREAWNATKKRFEKVKEKVAKAIAKGKHFANPELKDKLLSNPTSSDSLQDQPEGVQVRDGENIENSNNVGNPIESKDQATGKKEIDVSQEKSTGSESPEDKLSVDRDGVNQNLNDLATPQEGVSEPSENSDHTNGQLPEKPIVDTQEGQSSKDEAKGLLSQQGAENKEPLLPESSLGKDVALGGEEQTLESADSREDGSPIEREDGSPLESLHQGPNSKEAGSPKAELGTEGQERGLESGVFGGNSDNYSEDTIKQFHSFEIELSGLEGQLDDLLK